MWWRVCERRCVLLFSTVNIATARSRTAREQKMSLYSHKRLPYIYTCISLVAPGRYNLQAGRYSHRNIIPVRRRYLFYTWVVVVVIDSIVVILNKLVDICTSKYIYTMVLVYF